MTKQYHYIYKITNKINAKIYVGRHSTCNLNDNYMGSGVALQLAYNKYGLSNFTKEITHFCDSFKEVCDLEESIVNKEFISNPAHYNIALGGQNGVGGYPCSEETKLKMRLTQLGRKLPPRTSETKRKISDAQLGKSPTHQARVNQSKAWLSKLQRPWLNNAVKNNKLKLNPYKYLDLIYDLYVTYDFSKYGTKGSFTSKVKALYGYCPRQGMWNYFINYGDPRTDKIWVSFKQEVFKQ